MPLAHIKNHYNRWSLSGILLLTVLVFIKTLFFEFVWDDNIYLVGQAAYQSATLKQLLMSPLNGVEYLPLRDLSYIIDYRLWGWNPFGFHLSNLLLYCLNVLAVYFLTLKLNSTLFSSDGWGHHHDSVWIALVTSAIFAMLPLHSDVVSFIHSRNVLLSGLFFFMSCTWFLKFIDNGRWWHFVVAFVLFTCALLSKATVIILPLIFLLFLFFRPAQTTRHYLGVLAFLALAAVFFYLFKFHASESQVINEQLAMNEGRYGFLSRVAVAVQIPYFYIAKLIAPVGLTTEYQVYFSRDIFSPGVIAGGLFGCVFLVAAFIYRHKFPWVLFALLWFLVCLLPVLNFFLTNPVVADRYVYLSSFAYAFILAALLFKLKKSVGRSWAYLLLIPALGIYSWVAFERNDVWRTQVTVMEDMTKPGSNQVKGFNSLGLHYFEHGDSQKAFENFRLAREISPAFSELEFHQAKLAYQQNRPEEALALLNAASRFNEGETFKAWLLRGQIHESQGDLLQAARRYRKAVDTAPPVGNARQQAVTRLQQVMNRLEPSLQAARKDIREHPSDLSLKAKLAVMLQSMGLNSEAITLYEELLRLGGPKWGVYVNLGMLYKEEGRFERSIQNYKLSLSLNDASSRVHSELGMVYLQTGENEQALNHFETAARLDPNSAHALLSLAKLYFQMGNNEKAREAFNRIQQAFPAYEGIARSYLRRLAT